MSDLSRRNFLASGAAAAGAVVVVGQLGDGAASAASPKAGTEPAWFGGTPVASEPFVVYIRNAAKGEVAVLRGEAGDRVQRSALVGRLQRADASGSLVSHVIASRSTGDLQGPGRRQHRHLRLRQPRRPDTVTLISNYIPLEDPAGGPNFFEFGDDVLYRINIDNDGDGEADIIYEFRFDTRSATRTRSCTTPDRSPARQPALEPPAVLLGHADHAGKQRPPSAR